MVKKNMVLTKKEKESGLVHTTMKLNRPILDDVED